MNISKCKCPPNHCTCDKSKCEWKKDPNIQRQHAQRKKRNCSKDKRDFNAPDAGKDAAQASAVQIDKTPILHMEGQAQGTKTEKRVDRKSIYDGIPIIQPSDDSDTRAVNVGTTPSSINRAIVERLNVHSSSQLNLIEDSEPEAAQDGTIGANPEPKEIEPEDQIIDDQENSVPDEVTPSGTQPTVEDLPEEIYNLSIEELEQISEELGPTPNGDAIKQLIQNRKSLENSNEQKRKSSVLVGTTSGLLASLNSFRDAGSCCYEEKLKLCLDANPEFLDKYIFENVSPDKLKTWIEAKNFYSQEATGIPNLQGAEVEVEPCETETDDVKKSIKLSQSVDDALNSQCVNNALRLSQSCETFPRRLSFRIGPAVWLDNERMMAGEVPWDIDSFINNSTNNAFSDDNKQQELESPRLFTEEEVYNFYEKYGINLNIL